MKKITIILVLLIGFSVYAQKQIDWDQDLSLSMNQQTHWKHYTHKTELLIGLVNLTAIIILSNKYNWPINTQKWVTPLILVPTVGVTFYKTIEWNRMRKKI